ncbi:MAG: radical SAM protein, partial [Candidatus Binatia bacterium]
LPRALHVEGTNACNAQCAFCAYSLMQRPKSFLSMENFTKTLRDYLAMGGAHVSLTPIVGDPFLDPHLFERLERLAAESAIRGFYFFTNAIRMTPEIGERLLGYGERLRICVSLGGLDPETYRAIMGVDRFDVVWANLLAFVERKRKTGSATRLEIHLRCPRAGQRGPAWSTLGELERRGLVAIAEIDAYDSWAGKIAPADLAAVGLRPRPMPYKRGACELLFMKPVVLVNGEVNACACRDVEAELRVGDVRTQSLGEIWKADRLQALIARHERGDYPEVCRRCTYYVSVYNPLSSRIFDRSLNWNE